MYAQKGQLCDCTTILWRISVICMILLFCDGIHAQEKFVVSSKTGSWSEAETNCGIARAILGLVDSRARMEAFQRDVQVAPGVPVWVDRYVGYTSIVTIEGCYGNTSLVYSKITVMEDNTLVRCMTQCKKSLYIGMQGPICYCVDNVPQQSRPVSGNQCRTMCPGDAGRVSSPPVSLCGNVDRRINTVSLYRKVRPGEMKLATNIPNIGECISYNAASRLWQTDNCTTSRRVVCDRKPCNVAPVMCIEEGPFAPWIQARTLCENGNMKLASINFTTDDYFFNKGIMQLPIYWTGLHRQEVIIWGNDMSADEVFNSNRCVAMVKGQTGQWTWVIDYCSEKHRYVCLSNTTTTTTSRTTVATTTSGLQTGSPATTRRTTRFPFVTENPLPVNVTSAATSVHSSVIGLSLLVVLLTPLRIATMLL